MGRSADQEPPTANFHIVTRIMMMTPYFHLLDDLWEPLEARIATEEIIHSGRQVHQARGDVSSVGHPPVNFSSCGRAAGSDLVTGIKVRDIFGEGVLLIPEGE
jgi:hypothetical protein